MFFSFNQSYALRKNQPFENLPQRPNITPINNDDDWRNKTGAHDNKNLLSRNEQKKSNFKN